MSGKRFVGYCLPLIITCVGLLNCSPQVAGPGNSSDVGNPVVVASVHGAVGGSGPAGCALTMCSADYNPAASAQVYGGRTNGIIMSDTTDTLGKFSFDSLPEGYYNFIFDDGTGKALYIGRVPVFPDSVWTSGKDSLSETGTMQGKALGSDGKLLTWTFVYIPGTPFYSYTGPSGDFKMENIPTGRYTLLYYGVNNAFSMPDTFSGKNSSAMISPGDTVMLNASPE